MPLPWHKAPNAEILAGMARSYPDGFTVPEWLARVEARAVITSGVRGTWTIRRLRERWGWSNGKTGRLMRAVTEELGAWDKTGSAVGQERDSGGIAVGQGTQGKQGVAAESGTGVGQARDDSGTGVGCLVRARSIRRKEKEEREKETPPTPSRGAGLADSREDEQAAEARRQFTADFNDLAAEFYPGQQSALWNGGRPFVSPREMAKQAPLLEHGAWLPKMLALYAEACRAGDTAFDQNDLARKHTQLRAWAERGAVPFWAKSAKGGDGQRWQEPAAGPYTSLDIQDLLRDVDIA